MVDLLTENIDTWKDVGEVQDQSIIAEHGKRSGLIVVEWSVAGEMNRQGVSALAVGNYEIQDTKGDAIVIPAGAILGPALMLRDDHEAKVGSGTITPGIQTDGSTWEAMDNAVGNVARYTTDNGASNTFALGYKWAADSGIRVVVASNTVTAGAFTLFIPYYLGNAG